MKRFLSLILCIATLVSCGAGDGAQTNVTDADTSVLSDIDINSSNSETSTLMVYMVGSDLEAKSGAGTSDLEEMAESGIDTDISNVVVYAGGSPKWHNDTVSDDKEEHSILSLGEDGFETVTTVPAVSMGDAECLTNFLKYVYENFPSGNYSLIMWNHGNGPIIGYGKDMLYDNDSLTLAEMRQALENSPFGEDNKLNFVGFDACLMSSAELVCIWKDYADYLVASQEIEPSFGWDYDFLSQFGRTDTKSLLTGITEVYLETCEEYYDKKGFDDRDTTLACIDLSYASELEDCINTLFRNASEDVSDSYNELVSARVDTRALGRSSTGSEYDIIDLYDMAEKLSDRYPDETAELMSVIESMIVENATNTENLCGISLYYPFYNKKHYEKSWGETYADIGVLSDYAEYLERYSEKWLGNDFVENFSVSTVPEVVEEGKYTLELTDEQAETFAEASYYIMMREGDNLYTRVFSSNDVTREGNVLTANFDGQIIYAKNNFDRYIIPVVNEHDTVGDVTRYSVFVGVSNGTALNFAGAPEGEEYKSESYRFHLSANKKTKKISTSAIVPYNESVTVDNLVGGKLENADLEGFSTYHFPQERHRYVEYYDNGTLKPVSEWTPSDYFSQYVMNIGDGLEFMFAPVEGGEYYLVFEVEDTQSNKYCSDFLPIELTGGTLDVNYHRDVIDVTWESGDDVKLFEEEGITAYLTTIEDYNGDKVYALKVENDNDFDIAVKGDSLYYNGNVYCYDGSYSYFAVPAGECVTDEYGFSFGDTANIEVMGDLESLDFILTFETYTGERTIILDQPVSVKLSKNTTYIPPVEFFSEGYYDYGTATRGVLAEEQTIAEHDDIAVELVGFGGKGDENGKLVAIFRLKNNDNKTRYMKINGFVIDGIYVESGTGPIEIPAGCMCYKSMVLQADDLDKYMITSPKSLMVDIRLLAFATLEGGGGFSEQMWCTVKLTSQGTGSSFVEGDDVIFEEEGIRIALKNIKLPEEGYGFADTFEWYCTVVNNSGVDVAVEIENITVNGEVVDETELLSGAFATSAYCGDGQSTLFEINCYDEYGDKVEVSFNIVVYDIISETIIRRSDKTITLTGEK